MNFVTSLELPTTRKYCMSSSHVLARIFFKILSLHAFILGANVTHHNLNFDSKGLLTVYIDGACTNNGKPHAQAGYGVWFNFNNTLNLSSPVTGIATNNNAEIEAAIRAIQQALSIGIKKIRLHTDSKFLLNAMTNWIHKWKQNNWKGSKQKPVKNKEKFLELDTVMSSMEEVEWVYVKAHSNIPGNEEADALATAGAALYQYDLKNVPSS